MSKHTTRPLKTFGKRALENKPLWALVAPDGTVHPAWLYESKAELVREAPVQLYGDLSTWERATKDGYRAKKFYLTTTKPVVETKKPCDKKSVTAKLDVPSDTDMLNYIQKNIASITRTGVRSWRIEGNKKRRGFGDITLRRLLAKAIQHREA